MALQQQLAQQQAENEDLRVHKTMAEDRATGAEGYISYLAQLQGGNKQ